MRAWLLALAITALAIPATAGEVTIDYSVPAGAASFNTSAFGNFPNSSAITARIRLGNVTSSYALPFPLPAPLTLFTFTMTNNTRVFPGGPGSPPANVYCSFTPCNGSFKGVGSITTFFPVTPYKYQFSGLFNPVTGNAFGNPLNVTLANFSATDAYALPGVANLYLKGTMPTYLGNITWTFSSTGTETNRTFVPEPSTLPMVALGVIGLASAAWRTRSRKR